MYICPGLKTYLWNTITLINTYINTTKMHKKSTNERVTNPPGLTLGKRTNNKSPFIHRAPRTPPGLLCKAYGSTAFVKTMACTPKAYEPWTQMGRVCGWCNGFIVIFLKISSDITLFELKWSSWAGLVIKLMVRGCGESGIVGAWLFSLQPGRGLGSTSCLQHKWEECVGGGMLSNGLRPNPPPCPV